MFYFNSIRARQLKSLITACLLISLTGCASITRSKNQPDSINAVCDGQPIVEARCTLMNDKRSRHVKTPGSVMIQKAYADLAVDCKKGNAIASSKVKSSSNGSVWDNLRAGVVIGYAVDASSGAGFEHPSTMTITLPPPCGTTLQKTAGAE